MINYTKIEMSMLSIALQYPEVVMPKLLGDGITEDHFSEPRQKLIFNLMVDQRSKGKAIELISFCNILHNNGDIERVGGDAYIAELYNYQPQTGHYTYHLEMLRQARAKRIALDALEMPIEDVRALSAEELADHLRNASERVSKASESSDGSKDAKQACKEFLAEFEDQLQNKTQIGTSTGMESLDGVTNGMRSGELWIIAAPTSGGKSVMALQLALSTLTQGKRAGVFSLEMTAEENIARLISCHRGIDYGALRKPSLLKREDLKRMKASVITLSEMNLIICDEAGLSIDRICSLAQRWDDTDKVDTIIVDYMQLMQGDYRKGERTDEKLCRISGALKQLAKKLKCCVVALSQINADGRMAQASGMANDADVVLRIEGEQGVYVLKNRNGEKHMHLPLFLEGIHQEFKQGVLPNSEPPPSRY